MDLGQIGEILCQLSATHPPQLALGRGGVGKEEVPGLDTQGGDLTNFHPPFTGPAGNKAFAQTVDGTVLGKLGAGVQAVEELIPFPW